MRMLHPSCSDALFQQASKVSKCNRRHNVAPPCPTKSACRRKVFKTYRSRPCQRRGNREFRWEDKVEVALCRHRQRKLIRSARRKRCYQTSLVPAVLGRNLKSATAESTDSNQCSCSGAKQDMPASALSCLANVLHV